MAPLLLNQIVNQLWRLKLLRKMGLFLIVFVFVEANWASLSDSSREKLLNTILSQTVTAVVPVSYALSQIAASQDMDSLDIAIEFGLSQIHPDIRMTLRRMYYDLENVTWTSVEWNILDGETELGSYKVMDNQFHLTLASELRFFPKLDKIMRFSYLMQMARYWEWVQQDQVPETLDVLKQVNAASSLYLEFDLMEYISDEELAASWESSAPVEVKGYINRLQDLALIGDEDYLRFRFPAIFPETLPDSELNYVSAVVAEAMRNKFELLFDDVDSYEKIWEEWSRYVEVELKNEVESVRDGGAFFQKMAAANRANDKLSYKFFRRMVASQTPTNKDCASLLKAL